MLTIVISARKTLLIHPLELKAIVDEMTTFLAVIALCWTIFNRMTMFFTSSTICIWIEGRSEMSSTPIVISASAAMIIAAVAATKAAMLGPRLVWHRCGHSLSIHSSKWGSWRGDCRSGAVINRRDFRNEINCSHSDRAMEIGVAIVLPGFWISKGDEESDIDIFCWHWLSGTEFNLLSDTFKYIDMLFHWFVVRFTEGA